MKPEEGISADLFQEEPLLTRLVRGGAVAGIESLRDRILRAAPILGGNKLVGKSLVLEVEFLRREGWKEEGKKI